MLEEELALPTQNPTSLAQPTNEADLPSPLNNETIQEVNESLENRLEDAQNQLTQHLDKTLSLDLESEAINQQESHDYFPETQALEANPAEPNHPSDLKRALKKKILSNP